MIPEQRILDAATKKMALLRINNRSQPAKNVKP
jgi:hypothetical protein